MEKRNYERPDVEVVKIAGEIVLAAISQIYPGHGGRNAVGTIDADSDEEEDE